MFIGTVEKDRDQHLLDLETYQGVPIRSPARFVYFPKMKNPSE
jgi:hypothetical protein